MSVINLNLEVPFWAYEIANSVQSVYLGMISVIIIFYVIRRIFIFWICNFLLYICQVVPNTRSRSQMGETTDGGLFEIFQQDYGPVGSSSFEAARQNFIISSAGYAVASLLLQPKDRHNGNLLFDK